MVKFWYIFKYKNVKYLSGANIFEVSLYNAIRALWYFDNRKY